MHRLDRKLTLRNHLITGIRAWFLRDGWFLVSLLPMAVFLWQWQRYSVDFPYYDDMEAISTFVLRWDRVARFNSSWPNAPAQLREYLALLLEPNFEHRVLVLKLTALLQYKIVGHLDYRYLTLLGDFSLWSIWWLWFKGRRRDTQGVYMALIVAVLLGSFFCVEDIILWTTCALQHGPCVALTMWAVYNRMHQRVIWAYGLALLAMLSSANGLLAPVLVFAIGAGHIGWEGLILEKEDGSSIQRLKRFFQPAFTRNPTFGQPAPLSSTLILLIFTGISYAHLSTLPSQSGSVLTNITTDILQKIPIFFALNGTVAKPLQGGSLLGIFCGLLFLFPLVTLWRFPLTNRTKRTRIQGNGRIWLSLSGLLLIALTSFLIVFGRSADFTLAPLTMERYHIYSMLAAVFFVWWLDATSPALPRIVLIGGLGLSIVWSASSAYQYTPFANAYQQSIRLNAVNVATSQRAVYPFSMFSRHIPDSISQRRYDHKKASINADLYRQQQLGIIGTEDHLAHLLSFTGTTELDSTGSRVRLGNKTSDIQSSRTILLGSQTDRVECSTPFDGVYIALTSAGVERTGAMPSVWQYYRAPLTYGKSFRTFFSTGYRIPLAGWETQIFRPKEQVGPYKARVILVEGGSVKRSYWYRGY